MKSIKIFLSERSVFVEASKSRENAGRSTKDSAIRELDPAQVFDSLAAPGIGAASEIVPLVEIECRAVMHALEETGGDKEAASRRLRFGKTTLDRKLKEYDCDLPLFRDHPR